MEKAVKRGDLAQVETLLVAGADIEAVDLHGHSAAFWAARYGHLKIVRRLRARGADFNKRNVCGQTPFLGEFATIA